MEFLRQFIANLAGAWRRLSGSARVNIIVTGLLTAGLIAALVIVGSRPQFVRLYTNLDLDDTSAIQQYLEEQGVAYKVQDDGRTVLVPVQRLSDLRVALAAKRLPTRQGGARGLEIFDQQDVMTSKYLQDINYQRAIMGELQRMLNEFDFVEQSVVYIREAEESLFRDEQKPSEAAITLKTRRPLTEAEVNAVLAIVDSFGGANLRRDNISLVVNGQPAHLPAQDDFEYIANSKLDYVKRFERLREDRARLALMEMGVRSVVRVSLDIDFSSEKRTVNQATEGAVVSSWTTSTTTTGRELPPEGAPGATANLPVEMPRAGGIQNEESIEETVENIEPSKITSETTIPAGAIKKAQVTAIVDYARRPAAGGQGGEPEYAPRTDEELEKFRMVVAAAVGAGLTAEDVNIYDHPFEIEQVATIPAAPAGVAARDLIQYWGKYALQVVLVLVGLLLTRRMLRRIMTAPPAEEAPIELPAATREELRRREMAAEVERVSQQQPDAVASLLRTWMSESEE